MEPDTREWLHAEQLRQESEKRNPTNPLWIDIFAANAIFTALMAIFLGFLGTFPRNADNSIKAIYSLPTLIVLAILCAWILRRNAVPYRAVRIVCWIAIVFAFIAVPASLIDEFQRVS